MEHSILSSSPNRLSVLILNSTPIVFLGLAKIGYRGSKQYSGKYFRNKLNPRSDSFLLHPRFLMHFTLDLRFDELCVTQSIDNQDSD